MACVDAALDVDVVQHGWALWAPVHAVVHQMCSARVSSSSAGSQVRSLLAELVQALDGRVALRVQVAARTGDCHAECHITSAAELAEAHRLEPARPPRASGHCALSRSCRLVCVLAAPDSPATAQAICCQQSCKCSMSYTEHS